MARVALQVKNIASMILATGASLAWSFASRRFDSPGKNWVPAAVIGTLCLTCQLALIFVESKEEQELSLFRKHQMAPIQEALEINQRIQHHIQADDIESAKEWIDLRKDKYGK